ncbi:MAG: hypothetical protein K2L90_02395 [Muribaculaceae bacterium]|nr:hypothetical protein [Muribaculaceae bacterium]
MKMRSVSILMAVYACTGCAALSPADDAVERISCCVAENRLDSLTDLLPSLRISVADGNAVIAHAAEKSPSILGAALVITKSPREAAAIFVNMLAGDDTVLHKNASLIARQAISCYNALGLTDECDTFVMSVDENALRLPLEIQAKLLTECTEPDRLGRHICRYGDNDMIDAIRSAYGSDSLGLNRFNNALK